YYNYNKEGTSSWESENLFTYSSNKITVKNTYSNELQYTLNSYGKVTAIDEVKYVLENGTNVQKKLGHIDIEYDLKKTTFIDFKGNKVQYTFDNYGRTINILDNDGNAVFYQYENPIIVSYGLFKENYYKNNKIKSSSKPQKTIVNLINNHSF